MPFRRSAASVRRFARDRYPRLVAMGFALLVAAMASRLHAAEPPATQPPNVLLIISDDQTWNDYGFMGHPVIKTPHLDRLARESAVFRRGYVPIALCRPSLASMITGLYPHQHQITGNDPAPLKADGTRLPNADFQALRDKLISKIDRHPTLPKQLAAKGYKSHQSGKWWEGSFERGGFTEGMTHGDPKRGGRHGDVGLKIGREGLKPVLDFVDRTSSANQPFFLWYAPFLPHTPHNPPERLLRKYQAPDRPLPLARYYAMCEWFDETCGTLLNHLEDRGLAENTLVLYVTDNGWIQRTAETKVPDGWRSGFAPKSKQSPYDGGTRTPILVRWPSRVKPGEHDDLVSSLDLAPTILSACGVEVPKELPGINLLDLCAGKKVDRDAIFGESFAHDIADLDDPHQTLLYRWCIQGRWKLLVTHDGKLGRYKAVHPQTTAPVELYDLLADPWETKNLASAQPEVVQSLRKRLDQWWK